MAGGDKLLCATIAATLLGAFLLSGCGSSDDPSQPDQPRGAAANRQTTPKVGTPEGNTPPVVPAERDPGETWTQLADGVTTQLASDDLTAVAKSLTALQKVYGEEGPPEAEQQALLIQFETELRDKQKVSAHDQRDKQLEAGRELMDQGKFDDAIRSIEGALSRSPTDKQRQLAGQLKREIEYRRKRQRKLGALRKLLGSEKQGDVQSAQLQLRKEPDTAMPLLIDWVQRAEEPRLVKHALQTMRRIKRPGLALPAMLAVLSRERQQSNWGDAVAAIAGIGSAGIGPDLLKLVANSEVPAQRSAALAALSKVPDPPSGTLVMLLPLIHQDGPELIDALRAAFSGIVAHGQYDIPALRGIETTLNDEQQQQLAALPSRLTELIARGEKDPRDETARAAKILAVATRQLAAEPLTGVTVVSATAESETVKKEALVDGVWNSVELETMWYHPIASQPGTIVLDLGEEKTVVGVRVWNFNQPGGMHRGWKDVDIYVSNIKSELNPSSSGIIPRAPGLADTPDYSTVIPVEFVRGRYVKLKSKSPWRADTYMGLSEIQVLGF